MALILDASAEDLVAREGYDPVFGARPLKRAIQGLIQNPLALKLLNGEILPGDTVTISGDSEAGRMVIRADRQPQASPAASPV